MKSTEKPQTKSNAKSQASQKSQYKSQKKSQAESQTQASSQSKLAQSLFAEASVPKDAQKIIEDFDSIIQGIRPLNSRQLQQLPENIRNLSHQMTDDRSSRRLGYMNENIQLSAYVRYFTWWNLVRLTRLFSNLPATSFPKSDCICLDLGSGPLTVVTALYLARPELRSRRLTWYCLDVSANSMSLGEEIYLSVCARIGGEPWQIIRIKGSFGAFMKQKAGFITCANLLNELNQGSDMPPEFQVKKYYEQFQTYASEEASFLIVEPGVPKSSRTLSLLRERFIKDGAKLVAPCPHYEECPMSGFKAYTGSKHKWCNFAFSTEAAPKKLLRLSTNAKLPKERATLSFLSIINGVSAKMDDVASETLPQTQSVRIISDSFRLPNYMQGFYGCSDMGLVLLSLPDSNNTRLPKPPFVPKSGDLIQIGELSGSGKSSLGKKNAPDSLPKDEKSGAIIIKL